jgi:hypothetical protein
VRAAALWDAVRGCLGNSLHAWQHACVSTSVWIVRQQFGQFGRETSAAHKVATNVSKAQCGKGAAVPQCSMQLPLQP